MSTKSDAWPIHTAIKSEQYNRNSYKHAKPSGLQYRSKGLQHLHAHKMRVVCVDTAWSLRGHCVDTACKVRVITRV